MIKVLFVSLGCDKNRVDTEFMLGQLAGKAEFTDDESEADVIVVNTCCFIGDAEEESIDTILEMAQYRMEGKCRALIVCGCLAQRYQDEVRKEIPEVDAVLGTSSTQELARAIETVLGKEEKYASFRPLEGIEPHEKRILTGCGYYAYLKIAEGCDKRCTYCIIPSVRGSYRSVPLEDLVRQARALAEGGVRELILVAQETTLYGVDLYGEKSLYRLLDELNRIEGLDWIRILYCYPEEIDDRLIASIKKNEKVCHYLDMPIQHINDTVLRRMGRRTCRRDIENIVEKLREEIPDIALRTTIICGFPGETEEQHEELMEFLNGAEFDRLGAFTYSAEDGTPAAEMPDQIPEQTKENWKADVMELEEEIIADCNEELIGREFDVIIEGELPEEHAFVGRTYRDAPDVDGYVFIRTDEALMSGDFARVRITGAYEYDLIGELI